MKTFQCLIIYPLAVGFDEKKRIFSGQSVPFHGVKQARVCVWVCCGSFGVSGRQHKFVCMVDLIPSCLLAFS